MKKIVLVRGALVACMAVLSLTTTALAQEQSSEAAAPKAAASEKAAGAATGLTVSGSGAEWVSDYSTYVGNCVVGPRGGDVLFRCYGFGFTANTPRNVQCQPRNSLEPVHQLARPVRLSSDWHLSGQSWNGLVPRSAARRAGCGVGPEPEYQSADNPVAG